MTTSRRPSGLKGPTVNGLDDAVATGPRRARRSSGRRTRRGPVAGANHGAGITAADATGIAAPDDTETELATATTTADTSAFESGGSESGALGSGSGDGDASSSSAVASRAPDAAAATPVRSTRRRLAVVLPVAGIAAVLAAGGVGIGMLAATDEAQPGDAVHDYLTEISGGRLSVAYQQLCAQTLDEHATAGHAYRPGDFQADLLAQNGQDGGPIRNVSVTAVALAPASAADSERDVTVLVQREHSAASRVYRVDRQDGRYCLRTV